ncbi:hypothetical protein HYU17_05990 [Candidatus Woesearchaeota archaeon]|nr:hypothetical protein [Candidatus Woesearchaeota archaeon]
MENKQPVKTEIKKKVPVDEKESAELLKRIEAIAKRLSEKRPKGLTAVEAVRRERR